MRRFFVHHQQKAPHLFVPYAETTGLFLDDYYKATENINAFNPTRADANAIADALEEYVEVMDKDVYRGYLDRIRSYAESGGAKYSLSYTTDKLRNRNQQLYEDKLNIAQNTDDVVYASTNYINEDLNHPRRDNIAQFARENVLLEIGGNKYQADVVGYTSMNEMVLYDVQNLTSTNFDIKK